jgi:hypothetical protein
VSATVAMFTESSTRLPKDLATWKQGESEQIAWESHQVAETDIYRALGIAEKPCEMHSCDPVTSTPVTLSPAYMEREGRLLAVNSLRPDIGWPRCLIRFALTTPQRPGDADLFAPWRQFTGKFVGYCARDSSGPTLLIAHSRSPAAGASGARFFSSGSIWACHLPARSPNPSRSCCSVQTSALSMLRCGT